MSTAAEAPSLPATLRLGPVHLAVTDLERSTAFYRRSIGLQEQGPGVLGAGGEDLLVLHEEPEARPAGRHAGLYHFALLFPSRLELSRAARRLLETGTPISGASDHGISEAIYLPDPDGNGIELAADRGRERWGDLSDPKTVGPEPLDLADLLSMTDGEPLHPEAGSGLAVGHLHLHVGDVERALAFYRDLVGFEVMTEFPTAAFVAAGGYHHHLGLNTWRGEGAPPAPADAVGLRRWTVALGSDEELAALAARLREGGVEMSETDDGLAATDPWGHPVLFTA